MVVDFLGSNIWRTGSDVRMSLVFCIAVNGSWSQWNDTSFLSSERKGVITSALLGWMVWDNSPFLWVFTLLCPSGLASYWWLSPSSDQVSVLQHLSILRCIRLMAALNAICWSWTWYHSKFLFQEPFSWFCRGQPRLHQRSIYHQLSHVAYFRDVSEVLICLTLQHFCSATDPKGHLQESVPSKRCVEGTEVW